MLVMTTKVDEKKILIAVGALVLAILVLVALLGGGSGSEPTQQETAVTTPQAGFNDDRIKFLTDFGWDVTATPTESMQVRIPTESSEVFDRYNTLQKSQGYDLTQFAGKTVMRYVYQINNFPNASEPVYATVLVYKDQIIGGDVTNSGPGGQVQGFQMPAGKSEP